MLCVFTLRRDEKTQSYFKVITGLSTPLLNINATVFDLKSLPPELRTAVSEAHLADRRTENDLDSTSKTAFLALTKVCRWMREDVLLLAFSNTTSTITNPGQPVAQRFGNLAQPLRDAIRAVRLHIEQVRGMVGVKCQRSKTSKLNWVYGPSGTCPLNLQASKDEGRRSD
ncbi:hypothetical protein LTS18_005635 [Coniosporium uncinatum]|uniref:Uncharacterized protein n=1 Tax=Coniosporium uncinatum TaxID=93489 RepID=A0ACC3DCT9_9PEZI|nr:hypothetical protein LTS18_005635 [Coniosporium uncinatum]